MVAEFVEHRTAKEFYEQLASTETGEFQLETDNSQVFARFEHKGVFHSIPFKCLKWGVGMKKWLHKNI